MTATVAPKKALFAAERLLPIRMVTDLIRHRQLISQFVQRDISSRYRGTFFGLFWSFLSPLIMLAVYVFVFGFVFKSHFGVERTESVFDFGLALFCGLNLFNFFSEVAMRSPMLIVQYPNFVKKVVFPLEILPVVATGTALFHCLIAFLPLAIGLVIVHQQIPFTLLYLFLFLIPLVLLTCGASWVLASAGVFFRDVQPILTAAITILMFMSAVFFPLKAVPEQWRGWISLNPMVHLIEGARAAIIWGATPDWTAYFVILIGGLVVFWIGYFIFDRSKSAFADVV